MDAGTAVMDVGTSALTGWRGALGRAVAKPVAERTRFSREQVEAAFGIAMLAFAVYRLARPLISGMRRGAGARSGTRGSI